MGLSITCIRHGLEIIIIIIIIIRRRRRKRRRRRTITTNAVLLLDTKDPEHSNFVLTKEGYLFFYIQDVIKS